MNKQGLAVRPVQHVRGGSSLVRRIVNAKDDPGKQRVRDWMRAIDDERLSAFGLTPEDIALLRAEPNSGGSVRLVRSIPKNQTRQVRF